MFVCFLQERRAEIVRQNKAALEENKKAEMVAEKKEVASSG